MPDEKEVQFECPICKSELYVEVTDSDNGVIGRGYRVTASHFECAGCSVQFSNPRRFSNARAAQT